MRCSMKIERAVFENRKNPWMLKHKKNKKSFEEELEDSLNKKKSEFKRQAEKRIMDIII